MVKQSKKTKLFKRDQAGRDKLMLEGTSSCRKDKSKGTKLYKKDTSYIKKIQARKKRYKLDQKGPSWKEQAHAGRNKAKGTK